MKRKKNNKRTQAGKVAPVAAAKEVVEEKVSAPVIEATPAIEEKPAPVEVIETTPIEAAPAAVTIPAEVSESAPVEEKPAEEKAAPVEDKPTEAAPAVEAAAEEKPAKRRPGRPPKDAAAAPAKKPGRKPKAEAAKEEPVAEEKEPRQSRRSKVDIPADLGVFVQYQGGEVDVAAIAEAAKAEFKESNKRGKISSLKLYLKPEEFAAYYVINDDFTGKVSF